VTRTHKLQLGLSSPSTVLAVFIADVAEHYRPRKSGHHVRARQALQAAGLWLLRTHALRMRPLCASWFRQVWILCAA